MLEGKKILPYRGSRPSLNHMVKRRGNDLSEVFKALADPTRRQLIETLGREERTIGELAEPLEMSLPAVSKHLGVLERAGLLKRRREGKSHHMSFDPEALNSAENWLKQQRRFWEGSFDNLAAYLESPKGDASDHRPQTNSES